jgi:hypothetical protein
MGFFHDVWLFDAMLGGVFFPWRTASPFELFVNKLTM